MLHAESPGIHAELSCILHAKEFLLYFTWPLPVTLLRVCFLLSDVHRSSAFHYVFIFGVRLYEKHSGHTEN